MAFRSSFFWQIQFVAHGWRLVVSTVIYTSGAVEGQWRAAYLMSLFLVGIDKRRSGTAELDKETEQREAMRVWGRTKCYVVVKCGEA